MEARARLPQGAGTCLVAALPPSQQHGWLRGGHSAQGVILTRDSLAFPNFSDSLVQPFPSAAGSAAWGKKKKKKEAILHGPSQPMGVSASNTRVSPSALELGQAEASFPLEIPKPQACSSPTTQRLHSEASPRRP